jgi:hypothetical protein
VHPQPWGAVLCALAAQALPYAGSSGLLVQGTRLGVVGRPGTDLSLPVQDPNLVLISRTFVQPKWRRRALRGPWEILVCPLSPRDRGAGRAN